MAAILLCLKRPSWRSLCVAVMCGIVAMLWMANGVFVWPLGLLVLLLTDMKGKIWKLLFWLVIASALSWYYFDGLVHQGDHISMEKASTSLGPICWYILTFLGAPFAVGSGDYARIIGGSGLVLTIAVLFCCRKAPLSAQIPFLSLLAYSLICAAGIGSVRMFRTFDQALTPRYASFGLIFWLGLLGLFYLAVEYNRITKHSRLSRVGLGVGSGIFLATLTWVAVLSEIMLYPTIQTFGQKLELAEDVVQQGIFESDRISTGCVATDHAARHLRFLQEHSLSIFRK